MWEIEKLGFYKLQCYFRKNNYFRFRGQYVAKSILTIVLKIFKKNNFCVLARSKP